MKNGVSENDSKTLVIKIFLTLLVINVFLIIMRSSGINNKLSFLYLSRFIIPIIVFSAWSWIVYIFSKIIKKEVMIKTMLLLSCLSTTIFITIHYFILKNYCIPSMLSSSCTFILDNKILIENLASYYSISLICSMCIVSLFIIEQEDNLSKKKIGNKFASIIIFIENKKINSDLSANMLFISITILITLIPILFSISQEKTFLN